MGKKRQSKSIIETEKQEMVPKGCYIKRLEDNGKWIRKGRWDIWELRQRWKQKWHKQYSKAPR